MMALFGFGSRIFTLNCRDTGRLRQECTNTLHVHDERHRCQSGLGVGRKVGGGCSLTTYPPAPTGIVPRVRSRDFFGAHGGAYSLESESPLLVRKRRTAPHGGTRSVPAGRRGVTRHVEANITHREGKAGFQGAVPSTVHQATVVRQKRSMARQASCKDVSSSA